MLSTTQQVSRLRLCTYQQHIVVYIPLLLFVLSCVHSLAIVSVVCVCESGLASIAIVRPPRHRCSNAYTWLFPRSRSVAQHRPGFQLKLRSMYNNIQEARTSSNNQIFITLFFFLLCMGEEDLARFQYSISDLHQKILSETRVYMSLHEVLCWRQGLFLFLGGMCQKGGEGGQAYCTGVLVCPHVARPERAGQLRKHQQRAELSEDWLTPQTQMEKLHYPAMPQLETEKIIVLHLSPSFSLSLSLTLSHTYKHRVKIRKYPWQLPSFQISYIINTSRLAQTTNPYYTSVTNTC